MQYFPIWIGLKKCLFHYRAWSVRTPDTIGWLRWAWEAMNFPRWIPSFAIVAGKEFGWRRSWGTKAMDITYGRAADIRSLYMIFSRITSSALMIERIRRVEREIIHSTYMFLWKGVIYKTIHKWCCTSSVIISITKVDPAEAVASSYINLYTVSIFY